MTTTPTVRRPIPLVLPKFVCADGYTLSVQASSGHYCEPREDWPANGWTHVEVAAEDVPADWAQYACGEDGSGIYGWVPLAKVAALIESHGGTTTNAITMTQQVTN